MSPPRTTRDHNSDLLSVACAARMVLLLTSNGRRCVVRFVHRTIRRGSLAHSIYQCMMFPRFSIGHAPHGGSAVRGARTRSLRLRDRHSDKRQPSLYPSNSRLPPADSHSRRKLFHGPEITSVPTQVGLDAEHCGDLFSCQAFVIEQETLPHWLW